MTRKFSLAFSHVGLYVTDIDKMVDFYTRFLGFVVSDRVKRLVSFGRLNLLDGPRVAAEGPFDAIFCRNVLIYFDKPTQKRVVESFARALRPGGYLFLGHAESLFHLTDLYEPIVGPDAIVYRLKAPVPA